MTENVTIALSTTVRQSDNQIAAELDGDVVLMSIEEGKYYNLNDIASEVWARLEHPMTVATLCDALAREFDASVDTVRVDVIALLGDLYKGKLIEIAA
ncbi:PqqD family peptide modification chaperone [Novosphingobium beihaiensis]|uniref:PqqD family peptide modification chaperone n=1 Tax=Novosphingobium beihaiensis TaxID=2930389 RepID=A0ABT0BK05_9SPHN|nr:PqqD family peptide modification chaperone [Novosphingobium beihaiensis]MCJ2185382.1 PqqD family peptide modification chaperone [Novosphingobium beihaiensis]